MTRAGAPCAAAMSNPLIAILPGDGIGPEVTREARRVLEANVDPYAAECRMRTA